MSKRPFSKRKGKKKKKTTIENLVDGSIQLLEMNYFISQADACQRGGEKYSLLKQMMNMTPPPQIDLDIATWEYLCTLHLILQG